MTTREIEFPGYSPREAVRRAFMVSGPVLSGTATYTATSPFETPEKITIVVRGNSALDFKFFYPNDEPRSEGTRAITSDNTIRAILAKHTHKILELQVDDAAQRLDQGWPDFDERAFKNASNSQAVEARNAGLRNLQLVLAILRNMPDALRDSLRRKLSENDKPLMRVG